jgi:metallophosphoesterase (TIGR03767 family)
MSMGPAPLSVHQRLGAGATLRAGRIAPYRSVIVQGGEPHLPRHDLLGGAPAARPPSPVPLLCLAHLTDLQLADVQSPARFEFFNREFADPRFADLVPTQRPQEALAARAVQAMIRTLNRIDACPATGAPLDLVVTTGDAIDNAQWNELRAFLTLLDGGRVRPGSGGARYDGVQAHDWPDEVFWRPDGGALPDLFSAGYGFPQRPGLLRHALASFDTDGLRVPWLGCFGNHEALIQGVARVTPEVAAGLVGDRKPARLPEGIDLDRALELFIESPHVYLAGLPRTITADPERRAVTRREFVEAHLDSTGLPRGHGFTEANRRDGSAYYVHDLPAVRLIALDTTCVAGGDGAIDEDQLRWLEDRLVEVHARYRGRDGRTASTGNEDRLVVLFSHHGPDTLVNRHPPAGRDGAVPVEAAHVLALVQRFPNVVLWLNGHTHTNTVQARRDPLQPGRGFWEVTTCALMDWPCQSRIVELADDGDGALSITCTMLDHDGPASPGRGPSGPGLASLHRELAANVPWAGFGSGLDGRPLDRNVTLRARAPFPLAHLPRG